jgi:toxin ParE1/3/4
MATFSLTRKAKADLISFASYTQREWGKEQRRIYLRQFDDTFHMLAKSPDLGTKCDYIKLGYRKFPVSNHLIFYRSKSSSEIEIVRVLHKRMNAKPIVSNP